MSHFRDVSEQLSAMKDCLDQTKEELIHWQKTNRRLNAALQKSTASPAALCPDINKGGEVVQVCFRSLNVCCGSLIYFHSLIREVYSFI